MELLQKYMREQRSTIMEHNVHVSVIGRRDGLSEEVLREIDETMEISRSNTGLKVCLAINYGSRAELADAMQSIAREVQAGRLAPADVTEAVIDVHLYTAGMPEPDLLIRTAGEMRLSNFLLWQISYAEIWVTDCCWPDFDERSYTRPSVTTPHAIDDSEVCLVNLFHMVERKKIPRGGQFTAHF